MTHLKLKYILFILALFVPLTASCSKNVNAKKDTLDMSATDAPDKREGGTIAIKRGLGIDEYLAQEAKLSADAPDSVETESLWDETYSTGLLFVDHKARHVGDIITVHIIESSSASKNASTKTSRDSSIDAGLDNLLGLPTNFGMKNFLNSGQPFSPNAKSNYKNSFNGSGSTSRSGKITATITAEVVEVLPNGNLRISGSREIKVNEENQIITVSGVVRPQDIDETNSVKSTTIASAQIKYYGEGIIADKQSQGWLASIFDVIWPF